MSTQQNKVRHTPWIDLCRLIAMFGVITIHIAAPMVKSFRSIPLDAFITANVFDSLARVSVPLFIMISGTLLLGREPFIDTIGKRISRVALPLIFWSFLYVFWVDSWTNKPVDILDALSRMTQAPVMYHLWFVYMIIGVYILTPILRIISIALIAQTKFSVYFFTLWLVVNSITVYCPIYIIQQLNLSNFLGWPGYFILGYYLTQSEWLHSISARLSASVFFLASLCTFTLHWRLNALSPSTVVTAYDYFSPNVVIASCAAFLWFRQVKVSNFLIKPIAFMSSMTFPVYFIHIFIISILTGKNHGLAMSPYFIHPVIGILVLAIATFFISMLVAVLIRLMPYSSKITG